MHHFRLLARALVALLGTLVAQVPELNRIPRLAAMCEGVRVCMYVCNRMCMYVCKRVCMYIHTCMYSSPACVRRLYVRVSLAADVYVASIRVLGSIQS